MSEIGVNLIESYFLRHETPGPSDKDRIFAVFAMSAGVLAADEPAVVRLAALLAGV